MVDRDGMATVVGYSKGRRSRSPVAAAVAVSVVVDRSFVVVSQPKKK
jgi:hypothetical protein